MQHVVVVVVVARSSSDDAAAIPGFGCSVADLQEEVAGTVS